MTEEIRYPLSWSGGWKRCPSPCDSQFRDHSIAKARDEALYQIELLNGRTIIISSNLRLRQDGLPMSNQRNPEDRGVAVYFSLKEERIVLACDKWSSISHNLWAIGKHVKALRGQKRWGVGTMEQAFSGYRRLEFRETRSPLPAIWWETLGFESRYVSVAELKTRFRELAIKHHPDKDGNITRFIQIQRARDEGLEILKKGVAK